MTTAIFFFFIGLAFLFRGTDWAIRGSSRLGINLGVSPLVIGLIIVGMGVSMPELATVIIAAENRAGAVSLGIIIGSNIANMALVLGIAALIKPVKTERRLFTHEVPFMTVSFLVFFMLALDGLLSRRDGLIMLLGFVLYTVYLFHGARIESEELTEDYKGIFTARGSILTQVLLAIGGFAVLFVGARLVVNSTRSVAVLLGLAESAVAVTLISVVASLPELSAAIIFSRKGQAGIVVGTVVGSNVFKTRQCLELRRSFSLLRCPSQSSPSRRHL